MVGVILGETSSSLVKNLPSKSSIQKKLVAPSFFFVWCSIKGYTYLNKAAAFSCKFKYVQPFSRHQALKS